jgi:cell cycle arrest protein BUB2
MLSASSGGEGLRQEYETLLSTGAGEPEKIDENLNKLRELVLLKGFPQETNEEKRRADDAITLRGRVWKILLRVRKMNPSKYEELVSLGPSGCDDTIVLDATRTLSNEQEFRERVTNDTLVRVLNAWQHYLNKRGHKEAYCQGVNCYVAPLLYVMPELDAFHCLCKLTKWHCPLYLSEANNVPGVFRAVDLFVEILTEMDPELAQYLEPKIKPFTYAFAAIQGMNINLRPTTEWLQLWDVALCLGIHLHLIFTVARVLLIREQLFKAIHPNDYLGHNRWPPLPAKTIINLGMHIVRSLPENLYAKVLYHPFNDEF